MAPEIWQACCCELWKDSEYLIFDLVSIGDRFICILIWVKGGYKFIVVDVAIAVSVEDVRNCAHLQAAGGELYVFSKQRQVVLLT